jgi:hypothetical protein
MSASCVGTCSNCGTTQFWLSDTMSLQLDDGRLKCLPHPGESWACESHGLTLAQASDRGRLYRETFYVCRHCGREGETIEKRIIDNRDMWLPVGMAMKWGWGSAVIMVPFLAWMGWWQGAATIGAMLLSLPAICWWENRKVTKGLSSRGLPRPDAPGRSPIPEPTAGLDPESVIGRTITTGPGWPQATGPCCDQPDWIDASSVKDEDHVPCRACGKGVMLVSEHSLH